MLLAKRFSTVGYRIVATEGTAKTFEEAGVRTDVVGKIGAKSPTLLDMIQNGGAQLVVNTLTKGKQPARDGFRIRRESVENGVPCLTSLDTAEAMLRVIESMTFTAEQMPKAEVVH